MRNFCVLRANLKSTILKKENLKSKILNVNFHSKSLFLNEMFFEKRMNFSEFFFALSDFELNFLQRVRF